MICLRLSMGDPGGDGCDNDMQGSYRCYQVILSLTLARILTSGPFGKPTMQKSNDAIITPHLY